MYVIVQTTRQQKAFQQTWEYFCERYGWHNDPYAANGVRYNLLLPRKRWLGFSKVIGTVEFIPYDPHNPQSTVEHPNRFQFSQFEEVRQHQARIWEVDKLCIHHAYQRSGHFSELLNIFVDHYQRFQPKYYLALIERKLLRMLRMIYGFPIEQKGDAFMGSHTELVPVIIYVEQYMLNKEAVGGMKWRSI